jgi:alanyl-tRNA synthetase
MTEHSRRLFYEDVYRLEFEAEVMERLTRDGKSALVLDRTCFYPEGGGQPEDRGTLNGTAVVHVADEEGKILHVLDSEVEGEKVFGRVDGARRFDHMQQHTGQHILSQAFYELLEGETRSFHLGEDVSTLEIGLDRISEDDVTRVEERANAVVMENREIRTYFKDDQTIAEVPLRRPPKVSGRIRVVEVADYDYSACGGTHLRRTGEAGLIKITRWERIRDNLRFEFLCGWRAFRDYGMKHRQLRELSIELTIGESEVASSFKRMQAELKSLRRDNKRAREQLLDYEARSLLLSSPEVLQVLAFEDREPDEVRQLAAAVVNSKDRDRAVVFSLKNPGRVHLFLGCAQKLGLNMRDLVDVVCPLIEGRGGGSPTLVQIGGTKAQGLDSAVSAASSHMRSSLKLTL